MLKTQNRGMHERLHVNVKVELLFNLCMFSDFETQIILVLSVSISDRNNHIVPDHAFLQLLVLKPQDFMLSIKENHFTSKNQLTIT